MSAEPASEFHFSPRPNRAGEIQWRPWSPEAFEQAKAEDRPILLSISAVWCHWCHVMDETSYSDGGVIDLINREYVPVRVDNDVRPDINLRYNMGGWPTTAFLTPEGDILTGATYMPPEQMADALSKIASYYRLNKPEVVARVLEGRKRAGSMVAASAGPLDRGLVDRFLGNVESAYDRTYGGFGNAPKFPQTDAIALLAEQSALRREPQLMEMAKHTLAQMAGGGTYDKVEGGFFRYSTTQDWSVPHFEKMLEDHAGLVSALALTGQAEILDDAVRYLDSVLRDPETGLYAGSQDADEEYYANDAEGRASLTPPYVDRRVYVAWNCALAVAYLEADLRLDRPALRSHAEQALEAVFSRYAGPDGGLLHTDGVGGQLPDQVWGLLAATRMGWSDRARQLLDHLERRYGDPELGGYFDREASGELGRLGERVKPLGENAIAAIALHELGETDRARRALESVASLPRQYGIMAAVFARALDRVTREQVKVTTRSRDAVRAAAQVYPYLVTEEDGDGRTVVCIGTTCLQPMSSPEEVAQALSGL
ncbi:MAG: thioredoxin domain-containing protein [Candidatus Dormibacteraeota bacterium]|nr:thioredoxin domain-containing protein [Candidatus Dormibacteraeota bacterium]